MFRYGIIIIKYEVMKMDIYAAVDLMKRQRKTIFDLEMNVTFYARVSTTRDEQENSIENQIMFFTGVITP